MERERANPTSSVVLSVTPSSGDCDEDHVERPLLIHSPNDLDDNRRTSIENEQVASLPLAWTRMLKQQRMIRRQATNANATLLFIHLRRCERRQHSSNRHHCSVTEQTMIALTFVIRKKFSPQRVVECSCSSILRKPLLLRQQQQHELTLVLMMAWRQYRHVSGSTRQVNPNQNDNWSKILPGSPVAYHIQGSYVRTFIVSSSPSLRFLLFHKRFMTTIKKGGVWDSQKSNNERNDDGFDDTSIISSNNNNSTVVAFDRRVKLLQREGAARAHRRWHDNQDGSIHNADYYDYFRQEIANRLVDRLDDIQREEGFPLALDLGAGPGYIHRALCSNTFWDSIRATGGVRKLVQLDSSREMLFRDEHHWSSIPGIERCSTYRFVADEEGQWQFPTGTFDLVVSAGAIHWVNDLPKLLAQVNRILKPDGCFLLAMIGGVTLPELRASMVLAEIEREGGVSPHIGPFVQLSDVGALLQTAGFSLPTIDIDTIHMTYPHAMVVMEHLQRMGEANVSLKRKPRTSLDTFLAAACMYDHLFSLRPEEHANYNDTTASNQMMITNEVEVSVQVIYAIGWSPHPSQQQPAARGSATHRVGSLVSNPTSSETSK